MGKRASAKHAAEAMNKKQRLAIGGLSANVNTEYYTTLAQAYNTIVDHAVFDDILDCAPCAITDGAGENSGHEAPFDQSQFEVSIREKGHYKCGFNLMMIDWLWSPTPRVPVRMGAIRQLREHFFQHPGIFPGSGAGGGHVEHVPNTSATCQSLFGKSPCVLWILRLPPPPPLPEKEMW